MSLNFHKPLVLAPNVLTGGRKYAIAHYNADGNHVVWIDDMVFPIDKNGRVIASVNYQDNGFCVPAFTQLVVNAPEVKRPKYNLAVFVKPRDGNQYRFEAFTCAEKVKDFINGYKGCKTKVVKVDD